MGYAAIARATEQGNYTSPAAGSLKPTSLYNMYKLWLSYGP
jgi:hypothetical protein